MDTEKNGIQDATIDVDNLLAERARLDKVFNEKFLKQITVMFTDLKGSTAIADVQGDMASRTMIKHHNDIVLPLIRNSNGTLVKTMGDGTMSYFETAQDALRCAVKIQQEIDRFNLEKTLPHPILIRIGLHTGKGIVEEHDIFGDVVNVASRFESSANPGEIYLSEETFNNLGDKGEIYCRFLKTATLKGKKDPFKIYKAFWNPSEIEIDLAKPAPVATSERGMGMSPGVKGLLVVVAAAIVLFLALNLGGWFKTKPSGETRSKQHSVTVPAEAGR